VTRAQRLVTVLQQQIDFLLEADQDDAAEECSKCLDTLVKKIPEAMSPAETTSIPAHVYNLKI
jgi:hypothetical protein